MADAADDFVRLPQYFSPWLTPPSTPADPKLEASALPFHIAEGQMDATKEDGDRNLILDWVKENTRMNTVNFKSNDSISKASSVSHFVGRLKQSESLDTTVMRIGSVERQKTTSNTQTQSFFQDVHKNYFYDNNSSNNNHTITSNYNNNCISNIKSYATSGESYDRLHYHQQQQHHHNHQQQQQQQANFYHLACTAPDDVPKNAARTRGRLGCHGDLEAEEDHNDNDFVLEFLEAYRKAPEVTKFQAKVYLELCKESPSAHPFLFLCPDESRKFITLHDFPSPANQIKGCCNNNNNNFINNNINNNNNNGSGSYNSPSYGYQSPDDWKIHHHHHHQHQKQHLRTDHYSTNKLDAMTGRYPTPPVASCGSDSGGCRNVTPTSDRTTYAKTYAFDRIFMAHESMMDVYIESVTSVLKAVLSGHNGCILCYGEPDGVAKRDFDGRSGRGGRCSLPAVTLRWLYALLEESSHDTLGTYSVKVSALEFQGTSDSIRDLFLDLGMKVKTREAGEEQQPRFIRVASCKEACDVLNKAMEARSASSVNVLLTVHLRQYQARVPSHGKVVTLSNQLHIVSISDKQKEFLPKATSNRCCHQVRDLNNSLVGRDNLLQFIGSLMIGQRLPLSSLSRLHVLLQNCILPSNVRCQSSLVIRLDGVQNQARDVQKLLNLGTRIYKRRFSRNKHLRNAGQPFHLMNSSASETSSCASSGFSNLRKSRVRMGTQQWPRRADPVPAHCSDAGLAFIEGTTPSRPSHLDLQSEFVLRSASESFTMLPLSPSSLKSHWKSLAGGRSVQDTIPEQPEDRWEAIDSVHDGSPNHYEMWVDGPACTVPDSYSANLSCKTTMQNERTSSVRCSAKYLGCPDRSRGSGRMHSFNGSAVSGASFQHSALGQLHSVGTFQTNPSNRNQLLAPTIHPSPCYVRPSTSFESSERLIQNLSSDLHSIKLNPTYSEYLQNTTPSSSFDVRDPTGNFFHGRPLPSSGLRKSSLPVGVAPPRFDGRCRMDSLCGRFGSSSIYESWFEDKVESGSVDLLTESFTVCRQEPQGTCESATSAESKGINGDGYESVRIDRSNKSHKEKKLQLFKRIQRLFARNPFKRSSSSSILDVGGVARYPNGGEPSMGSATHRSELLGSKKQQRSDSGFEHGPKKHFSLFGSRRHRSGSQKVDLITTAPNTPSCYYDNQAADGTITSNRSTSATFVFPTLSSKPLEAKDDGVATTALTAAITGSRQAVGAPSIDSNKNEMPSVAAVIGRSQRRGGFFAFSGGDDDDRRCDDDDDDDGNSQIESSVANVVCYRKMAFPKRGSDQGSRTDNTFLTPSYYRFSKLSSDGEQISNNNNNNNNDYDDEEEDVSDVNNNNNNNGNNNNNYADYDGRPSSAESNSCDNDGDDNDDGHCRKGGDDDDDEDASDDYVEIKMANVSDQEFDKDPIKASSSSSLPLTSSSSSSSSSSSQSLVKNASVVSDNDDDDVVVVAVQDDNDNDDSDDNDDETLHEVTTPETLAGGADDQRPCAPKRRSKFSGFISRGKQLMTGKSMERERCVVQ